MFKTIKGKKVTWINIQRPTKKDLSYLKKNFDIHPVVLDELINPGLRPKVERYDKYIFMILYYPVYDKEQRVTTPRELNIIATKNTLITSHYEPIYPLNSLFNSCSKNREAREAYMKNDAGEILYYVLSSFWKNSLSKLQQIKKRINDIQKGIFKGKEREMVREISFVKTDIINFWIIVEPQEEIIDSLLTEGIDFFGEKMSPYLADLSGTYDQVFNTLESYKEVILALEDTNQSLLSTRINEIMKILTIFSAVLLPLTLISSVWGMNFPLSLPFQYSPMGFWIVVGLMLIGLGVMISFFQKKNWL